MINIVEKWIGPVFQLTDLTGNVPAGTPITIVPQPGPRRRTLWIGAHSYASSGEADVFSVRGFVALKRKTFEVGRVPVSFGNDGLMIGPADMGFLQRGGAAQSLIVFSSTAKTAAYKKFEAEISPIVFESLDCDSATLVIESVRALVPSALPMNMIFGLRMITE